MESLSLDEQVKSLPKEPGVYQFFNKEGEIIYIGKAKSLKSRVSSYFLKQNDHSRKTRKLVTEITALRFIVVNSEGEALLLENSLIKQHQPKYNIRLKDDKSYPYICITQEPFPRVFATRQRLEPKHRYFGPYANVKAMNNVLELIQGLYKVRSCQFYMDEQSVAQGKHKICLEYHIKNCLGPCEGFQSREEYAREIDLIAEILKGKLAPVKQYFKEKMLAAAGQLDFETAQYYKERGDLLDRYQEKSLVVNPNISDLDVCCITSDAEYAYLNFLHIINGAITQSQSVEIAKKLDEDDEELLLHALLAWRETFGSDAKRVITNIALSISDLEGMSLSTPKIGDLRKLVELSVKNLMYFKKERMATKVQQQDEARKAPIAVVQLQHDLGLQELPTHIECFDNSNIQGTNPVAAMVCFKDGKPAKSDYRKFHVKTVIGPDDFASMREIVHRRYSRLLEEGEPLPKLIVIDGGKGQLGAACESLKELELYGKVPIIGIAKRLEEIYYPEDQVPLHISKKSPSLNLLQRIRDEAHRFAITFHRDTRSATSLIGTLDGIAGIGPKTAEKLLQTFKTVSAIKKASLEEIASVIGLDKAQKLQEGLQKK